MNRSEMCEERPKKRGPYFKDKTLNFNIRLTPEQYQKLQEKSLKNDTNIAMVIRKLLS